MASIEECVTQPSIIKFDFNELTIDESADKWTAKCKICKQKLVEKRGIIIIRISRWVLASASLVVAWASCVVASALWVVALAFASWGCGLVNIPANYVPLCPSYPSTLNNFSSLSKRYHASTQPFASLSSLYIYTLHQSCLYNQCI